MKHFIRNLTIFIKERLEFENPKSMDEAILKSRIYYQHMRQKDDANKGGPNRKGKKGFQNAKSAKMTGNKTTHRKQPNGPSGKNTQKLRS